MMQRVFSQRDDLRFMRRKRWPRHFRFEGLRLFGRVWVNCRVPPDLESAQKSGHAATIYESQAGDVLGCVFRQIK